MNDPMSEERLESIAGFVANDETWIESGNIIDELLAEVHRLRDGLKAVERNRDGWRASAEAEASAHDEARDELNRLRTLPPEVVAAMERLRRFVADSNDCFAIAAHFTTLFAKGNQP